MNWKKALLIAAVAGLFAFGSTVKSEARVSIGIGIGIPVAYPAYAYPYPAYYPYAYPYPYPAFYGGYYGVYHPRVFRGVVVRRPAVIVRHPRHVHPPR